MSGSLVPIKGSGAVLIDKRHFYNRKLGRPYTNPSQVPITLELLRQKAFRPDISWSVSIGENYMTGIQEVVSADVNFSLCFFSWSRSNTSVVLTCGKAVAQS